MGAGAGDGAKLHEGARETGPGPHIRACFEKSPEVLRQRSHAGLNKGEASNSVRRCPCFNIVCETVSVMAMPAMAVNAAFHPVAILSRMVLAS